MHHPIFILTPKIKQDILSALHHIISWSGPKTEIEIETVSKDFLDRLLNIVNKHNITLTQVFTGGNVALTIAGIMDNKEVVVKLNPKGKNPYEILTLEHFSQFGYGVQILAVEDENSFVMEKFGVSLASCNISLEDKINHVATLIRNMHQVEYQQILPGEQKIFKADLSLLYSFKHVQPILEEFEHSEDIKNLHYDIQDHNILCQEGICKIIDPKCVVGDRHFENYLLISSSDTLFMRSLASKNISPQEMLNYVYQYAEIADFDINKLLKALFLRVVLNAHKNQNPIKDHNYKRRKEWFDGLMIMKEILEQQLFN